jgi:hypothetical protein
LGFKPFAGDPTKTKEDYYMPGFNYSRNDAEQEKEAISGGQRDNAPWPAGEYDAEIFRSEAKVSKSSGADMIALGIKIFNDQGKFAFVNDYLVGSDNVYSKHKIKQAALACGLEHEWQSGALDADSFQGRSCKVKIKIGKEQPKNDGSGDSYPAKNEIADYILTDSAKEMYAANRQMKDVMAADDLGDEIPF